MCSQSINQSINQSNEQSFIHSFNQIINHQSINQSIDRWIGTLPWAMGRHWTWSWCGRDIPHGSWRWAVCPCRNPCHRPASGLTGIPAGNRSFRPPCARHLALSPPIRRPRCSGPWPNCSPHRFDLKWKRDLCKNTRKELKKNWHLLP